MIYIHPHYNQGLLRVVRSKPLNGLSDLTEGQARCELVIVYQGDCPRDTRGAKQALEWVIVYQGDCPRDT